MDMELKTFLSSGGKLLLLGAGIVGEFNTLVNGWEMNEWVKEADPMQATFKDFFLIDILSQIISYDGKLCGLDTFNSYCDVNDESHEAQTQREKTASLACAHTTEWFGTILKTVVHYSSKKLIR